MSHEHRELHRRVARAFDDKDPDALLALMADDVVAAPRVAPMEDTLSGHEGIRRAYGTEAEALEAAKLRR